jgi:hypothetical protein
MSFKEKADDSVKALSRFGMAAKGVTYLIAGTLTVVAAVNLGGGKISGKTGVFEFLLNQSYGQVLLALLGVGLVGYAVWRGVQVIKNPEDEDVWHRIAYSLSGLFYLGFAIYAFKMVISGGGSSGGGNSSQKVVGKLLEQSWGVYAVGLIGLLLLIKAVYQFYKAYRDKYKEEIEEVGLKRSVQEVVEKAGKIGYTARGIIMGIIAFFFFRAAWQYNASSAGGTKEAFGLLQDSTYGTIILAVVALGIAAYGVFMIIKARYKVFPSI